MDRERKGNILLQACLICVFVCDFTCSLVFFLYAYYNLRMHQHFEIAFLLLPIVYIFRQPSKTPFVYKHVCQMVCLLLSTLPSKSNLWKSANIMKGGEIKLDLTKRKANETNRNWQVRGLFGVNLLSNTNRNRILWKNKSFCAAFVNAVYLLCPI